MENKTDSPNKQSSSPNPFQRNQVFWVYLGIFLLFLFFLFRPGGSGLEITGQRFLNDMLAEGDVEKIEILDQERVNVYIRKESLQKESYSDVPKSFLSGNEPSGPQYFFNIGSIEMFLKDLKTVQGTLSASEQPEVLYHKSSGRGGDILMWLLPLGLLLLFWRLMLGNTGGIGKRGVGSIFSFGQSRAKEFAKGATSVTFADIAGLEEAKEEINELVKFLKAPERYKQLGAKIPKGVLLVGPPGTGKTLLAKAVAGEAKVPFFSLSGSEFIEMFVGVGAARMRDLFEKAKAKAPSIIFIDEIDTVGRTRGRVNAFQSNDERESTLNQLLAELDGFESGAGVIVMAATNRGDILDPALLRPGRFDRHIHLELPNLKERKAIFQVHIKPLRVAKELNLDLLAAQTPGFSGADIANICNEAALIAARGDKQEVQLSDFMDAIDRVIGGLEKKSKIISAKEKRRIAYHEAGHVTVSMYLEHAASVLKVSIIPRGKSLGAAWFLPKENQVVTKSQFINTICSALGGRAAEEIVFEEVSSNALDDLEKVTKLAYSMVMNYGLSEKLRNLSFFDSTGQIQQSLHKPYSEKTAELIDQEAQRIVDDAYEKTLNILREHRDKLDILAERLIQKELVVKEEIEEIFQMEQGSNPLGSARTQPQEM